MRESGKERVKANVPPLLPRQGDGYEPTPHQLGALPPADPCDRRCPSCGAPLVIILEIPKGRPPTAMPLERESTALVPRAVRLGRKPDPRAVETRRE